MAIDWDKEWQDWKRIFFGYMKVGLIALPFGVIYGLVILRLGHESTLALVICLIAAFLTILKIQGIPPVK